MRSLRPPNALTNNRTMKRIAPLCVVAALAGCGGNSTDSTSPGLFTNSARDSRQREETINRATRDLTGGNSARIVESTNDFGFRLLQEVDSDPEGNVMVSPLSIATALSMTMNGAKGRTREEMQKVLGVNKFSVEQINEAHSSMRELLGSADPAKSSLRIANSIWSKQGVQFETEFLSQNANSFNAKIGEVDLTKPEGYRQINEWVKSATEGKIPSIISEDPDPDLRIVLVNAIYFKAGWKDQFDKENTKSGVFQSPKQPSTVDFMTRSGKYGYAKHDWATIVSLPYAETRFDMILALPPEKGDFDKFVKKFASEKSLSPGATQQILLTVPKWKSSYEKELKSALTKLGMGNAFSDDADFSLLKKDEKLSISKVVHKSFVEVNEEGTEAAAATGVQVGTTSAPAEPTIVRFDRPFAYAIRENKTGQILFLGIMRNPAKS